MSQEIIDLGSRIIKRRNDISKRLKNSTDKDWVGRIINAAIIETLDVIIEEIAAIYKQPIEGDNNVHGG